MKKVKAPKRTSEYIFMAHGAGKFCLSFLEDLTLVQTKDQTKSLLHSFVLLLWNNRAKAVGKV
jgi:hypothetical protein